MPPGEERQILRAKYHDWCSARVADRFLTLTPEEIYSIAHGGGDDSRGMEAAADASVPERGAGASSLKEVGYPELVERLTSALARELGLPGYEEWVEAYRRDPERYDAELIGFWRSAE